MERANPAPLPYRPVLPLTVAVFLAWAAPLFADETVYVQRGAEWRYFRGLEEASSPVDAWRAVDFDDSSWPSGNAPFGYGDGPFGTDLNTLTPPMVDNYTTLFLRRTFEVSDPSQVVALEIDVDYDDGFALWINGADLLRINAPAGALSYQDTSTALHESGTYENIDLADPAGYLVAGTNVIAVQVFNWDLDSSDLKLDLDLVDPFGPDLSPPNVRALVPAAGTTVRSLTQIEVRFDEEVDGVDAADLLVNGSPAASVSGTGTGPYVFGFPEPPDGAVSAGWAADHDITDLSPARNAFAGGSWSYTLDPDAPEGDLVITEFLAGNRTGIRDEDGERSDWIEVTNRGATTVSLGGWTLTDDAEEPAKFILPPVSLAPQEAIVIFASGKDRPSAAGEIHTSFKLNSAGEYLGLYRPELPRRVASEFAPDYPEQRPDFSYGIDATGAPSYFDPPTPGEANGGSLVLEGMVAEPIFSVPRGFYDESFSLELSAATPDSTIYYTLDGTEPSPSNGTRFTTSIDIDPAPGRGGIHVRAAAYRSGFLPSDVVTHTYIFLEDILSQPNDPAGFPRQWGNAPAVDYEMDSQVVGTERAALLEGLVSIPSLSIVMDTNDMFGSSGIYSNPGGEGVSWERACSAELIFPDGRRGFQVNCGIRIQGGASRQPNKSPKHSLRLLFKGAYGPTKLRYPFFPGSPVEEFDTITFRANYNNSWIHWDSGQRGRGTMIRDQFIRDSQLAMSGLSPRGNYCHVYINGLYWGVYNPTERPSAPFAASYLGGEKEEYDALNSGQAVDGDRSAWNTMFNIAESGLSEPSRYLQLQDWLNIPDFIDYMLVNFYGANADWPHHNWYAVRRREPGAQYRFMSWDAERVLEGVTSSKVGAGNNDSPGELHQLLRANEEYRLLFADRTHRHLFAGGALTPEAVADRWNARRRQLETAVVGESARWGDYRRDVHSFSNGPYEFYRRSTHWVPEMNRLNTQYFPSRTRVLLDQLRSAGLYPSVEAPVFNRHGGDVSPGFLLTMSLPAGQGGTMFFTLDGEDPRVSGTGDISPSAFAYDGGITVDDFTHVEARTLSGGEWSALSEATFTVIEPRDALRITEIMYHSPSGPEGDFIELGNLSSVTVDLSGLWFSDGIFHVFPSGTSLGPGERLVLVEDAQVFSGLYPDVEVGGVYALDLSNGGERVTLSDASGEAVVSVEYDDADFWPLGPDGYGWSLVLADPGGDGVSPGSFRESAEPGGSPGAEDPPAGPRGVLVNEVLANSTAPLEDAVELHNPGTAAVDIGGWYLSDSRLDAQSLRKYRIPEGTVVPAGGYAVFYEADFNPSPGSPGSFALGSDGDDIYLSSADAAGELAGYIVGADFGASRDGVSLGRAGTSVGFDFTALDARTFGVDSPGTVEEFRGGRGAANSEPLVGAVVINEVHYHPVVGVEFVELHNRSGVEVSLHDAGLGRGFRLDGLRNALETDAWEFPEGARIAAGGYLVVAPVSEATFRALRAVPAETPVVGPYGGALANGGEHLRLEEPLLVEGEVAYARVDHVRFDDRAPWPEAPDGGGPSLERVSASEYGNEPLNWAASEVGGGTPGAPNTVSGPGVNQRPRADFVTQPSGGDPLEVVFDASSAFDPDGVIVEYAWDFGDGAAADTMVATHRFASPGIYLVELTVTDDDGDAASVTRSITVSDPTRGGQVPGDSNQDARVDISDAVSFLRRLFVDTSLPLPCDGESVSDGGNRAVFDVNGDLGVNITDAVYTLNYLFTGGPPPVLGTGCVAIEGCSSACAP